MTAKGGRADMKGMSQAVRPFTKAVVARDRLEGPAKRRLPRCRSPLRIGLKSRSECRSESTRLGISPTMAVDPESDTAPSFWDGADP
jgi:hypothetical protein